MDDAIRRSLSSIKLYYLYWQLTRLSSWLALLTQISLSLSLSICVCTFSRCVSSLFFFFFSFFSPQKIIKLLYHAILERDYDFAPGGGLHYIFAIVLVSFWKMETLSYFHTFRQAGISFTSTWLPLVMREITCCAISNGNVNVNEDNFLLFFFYLIHYSYGLEL